MEEDLRGFMWHQVTTQAREKVLLDSGNICNIVGNKMLDS